MRVCVYVCRQTARRPVFSLKSAEMCRDGTVCGGKCMTEQSKKKMFAPHTVHYCATARIAVST